MIVFDLNCADGHVFEAWFASSASFDEQCTRGLVVCPVCGDHAVGKAVTAPRIGAKSNQRMVSAAPRAPDASLGDDVSPAVVRKVLAHIAAKQAEMLPQSRWVGGEFAAAARAMHEGRATEELIHGQASPDQARALHDDGIAVLPLLVPIVPPEAAN